MKCKKCSSDVGILEKTCPHCGNDLRKIDLSGAGADSSRKRGKLFDSGGMVDEVRTSLREELDSAKSEIFKDPPPRVVSDAQPTSKGRADRFTSAAPFMNVTTKDVQVAIENLDWVNYSLAHAGLSQIARLCITNTTGEDAENVFIKIWIPDYGDQWHKTIARIPAGGQHVEEHIKIHLNKKRLEEVDEAENAVIQIEITADNERIYADTLPVRILAFNEWVYVRKCPELIASFIMPNSTAVETVVNSAKDQLHAICSTQSFDGYQTGDPDKADKMVAALHAALQKELTITYINPPVSFEKTGQKIFLPDKIVEHQRGTCLDLSLFYAACIERIGLDPVIFLVHGHAFLGYWRVPCGFNSVCANEISAVQKAIEQKTLAVVNSTTFTLAGSSFAGSVKDAQSILEDEDIFEYAIDVSQARANGILPMD